MKNRQAGLTRAAGRTSLIAAAALAALMGATGAQAVPYPTADMPAARDLGAAGDASVSVLVALKGRDEAGLQKLVAQLHTPGDPQFRHFLTPAQYHARFDAKPEAVAAVTAYFQAQGLTVRAQEGGFLEVSGPARAHEKAFGVTLHQWEVPAHGRHAAIRFHASSGSPKIASASVAALVDAVVGLDGQPRYAPRLQHAHPMVQRAPAARAMAAGQTLNAPGAWTVNDLAAWYDVNPLYAAGYHGEGRTIGIVTLASFTPSDAYHYWSDVGLTVDPDRIRVEDVAGGPGAPSDAGGSSETTLDVEQAGGLAPAAKIIVYQAPNTDKAFLTAFAHAVDQNVADTISVSWGGFEWFDTLTRPHGRYGDRTYLRAFDKVFLQAAVQGQSLFAAQGDAGAYEVNRALTLPQYTPTLSVGAPAASPWITSAGGTTLPGTMTFSTGDVVTIDKEQAWGWSYLTPVCQHLGYDPVSCGIFPVGTGGGVSSFHALPSYQKNVPGMRVTEAGQSLVDTTTGTDYVDLPAGFAGRNVPDVSLNADPETGYVVEYTSDTTGFGVSGYGGGTSFVAPQLNGIAAVVGQRLGGRLGLLNFPLYEMAKHKSAWHGTMHPFNDVKAGDNWFYTGVPGYDNASGVGTLDVANFAEVLAQHVGAATTR